MLVEVEPPGTRTQTVHLRIEAPGRVSDWFRWARVSACDTAPLAGAAGFHVSMEWAHGDRRFVRLRASGAGAR